MVVAKRQRKEKPVKMEERKSEDQSDKLRWNKEPSWLAQFAEGRLRGRRKKYIKRSQNWAPLFFWVSPPSYLEDLFSFACQIKLSYNWCVTLVSCFKSLLWWDRTKEITHSLDNIKWWEENELLEYIIWKNYLNQKKKYDYTANELWLFNKYISHKDNFLIVLISLLF